MDTKQEEQVKHEVIEGLGISDIVYSELCTVVGKIPTADEVSTLLAMWELSGKRQGLLTWLRGQPHKAEQKDYLSHKAEKESLTIAEPKMNDCIQIAKRLFAKGGGNKKNTVHTFANRGDILYMVGDVSELFTHSRYGQQYLHLVENALAVEKDTELEKYVTLLLTALEENKVIRQWRKVTEGGLMGTLIESGLPVGIGFDIICCREVRLDAFLFGEQGTRYVVDLAEDNEDVLLQKLTEGRLNCCFLGRTTKGRIVVDGTDFGDISTYGE